MAAGRQPTSIQLNLGVQILNYRINVRNPKSAIVDQVLTLVMDPSTVIIGTKRKSQNSHYLSYILYHALKRLLDKGHPINRRVGFLWCIDSKLKHFIEIRFNPIPN